ncbi:MAG TPA: thioredoxin family protein [Acidisarcina sp.]|nr:thioredoxin family protein [Acidisarcina sp.]
MLRIWIVVAMLATMGAAMLHAAPVSAPHLTVELLTPTPAIASPGSFEAGLYFKLEKGWHIYWVNAGDSGLPPTVKWNLPPGFSASPIQFPTPGRLPLGPYMDYGYENEVLFPIPMKVKTALKPGQHEPLAAKVDWLVCREVCIPGKANVSLDIAGSATTPPPVNPDVAALFDRLSKTLPQPLPASWQVRFAPTATGFRMAVITGKRESGAQFFPLHRDEISNPAPEPVQSLPDGLLIDLKKDEDLKKDPDRLRGLIVLDGVGYLVNAQQGTVPTAPMAAPRASAGMVLRIAGLAMLGGLLLNLMPCVFPVLFLKGLALVQSSTEDRHRMRMHGMVYALGILVSFWAVVAALLLLRAGGRQLGWGFQFQSPVFVALMAMLLFFLGLSLAGQFEIGLTLTSAGSSLAKRSGYTGSFFTGVLAMVVATPCTAPFMGVAIGFALAQPAGVTFLIFTAVALGLALPYLLLTFNPAWTRLLPRPGAWMEVLKQATAIPVFGTVIWLVWVFTQSAGVNALIGLLAALLMLAVAGWIVGRWPAKRMASVFAIVVAAIAVAIPVYAVRTASPIQTTAKSGDLTWEPFTPAAVEKYRALGKPVFVDFTASWCLSCQVNEHVVLDRSDVQQRLKQSGMVLLRADWTQHDGMIAQTLAQLGRSGVPTYAIYPASATEPPRLLPEVLTAGIVIDALNGLQRQ